MRPYSKLLFGCILQTANTPQVTASKLKKMPIVMHQRQIVIRAGR